MTERPEWTAEDRERMRAHATWLGAHVLDMEHIAGDRMRRALALIDWQAGRIRELEAELDDYRFPPLHDSHRDLP